MVPGYVQGMSRVPPDHAEGGGGGRLYLERLWKTLNSEPRTSNLEPRTLNSRAKPPKATSEPLQSLLIANRLRPQSHPKASSMRQQSADKATRK